MICRVTSQPLSVSIAQGKLRDLGSLTFQSLWLQLKRPAADPTQAGPFKHTTFFMEFLVMQDTELDSEDTMVRDKHDLFSSKLHSSRERY